MPGNRHIPAGIVTRVFVDVGNAGAARTTHDAENDKKNQ